MTYSVRLADTLEDKQQLLSLWKRNFLSIEEKRYKWIYENNPTGPPSCYLLHHEPTGALVGAIGLFPRNLYAHGKLIPAFVCGDLVVDRGHRSIGPAIKLIKAAISQCEQDSSCVRFGFPNQTSLPVMLRCGFKPLGNIKSMTRVLKTNNYIRRYIHYPPLECAISFPLDLLIRLRYSFTCHKQLKSMQVAQIPFFDPRFDALWQTMQGSFALVGEKTSDYLNWRFTQSPYKQYTVFGLTPKGASNLTGYIVYSIADSRVQIEDYGCRGNEVSFGNLIAAFLRYQALQGICSVAVSIVGSAKWVDLLKRYGFSLRPSLEKAVIYAHAEHETIMEGINQGTWFLMAGDNDI